MSPRLFSKTRTARTGGPQRSRRLTRNRRRLRIEALERRALLAADPIGGQVLIDVVGSPPESSAAIAIYDTSPQPSGGSFVAVWQSYGDDGDGFGIYARAFAPDGTPLGTGPVQVNVPGAGGIATGNQIAATVASDGAGSIVVAWQTEDQVAGGYDIAYRMGSIDGAGGLSFAAEGLANTAFVTGDQTVPTVAMDGAGNFLLAWQTDTGDELRGLDVVFKRGTLAGLVPGDETAVSTTTAGDQVSPAASSDAASGDFVVAWKGPDSSAVAVAAEEEESAAIMFRIFKAGTADATTDLLASSGDYNDVASPDVAMGLDGRVVVVWQIEGAQGSGSDVYGRRFAFDRDTLGVVPLPTASAGTGDFRLNTTIQRPQRAATVGIDADGDFLAAWQSQKQDGFSWGIVARRYDATTDAFGAEVLVNVDEASGPQIAPDVAVAPDGRSAVAWIGSTTPEGEDESEGEGEEGGRLPAVLGRIFADAGGSPIGGEIVLATFSSLEDRPAATAADAAGNFVVVWQEWASDGSDFGIRARLFQADGQPAPVATFDGSFAVNTFTVGSQSSPAVAMDAAGDFVAVWQSARQDGSGAGIYARRYDASLQAWADPAEFLIAETLLGDQATPAVGMDGEGNFTVVWTAADADGTGIFARRFTAAGTPLGGEFRVNVQVATDQVGPVIGMNAAGQAVIAWVSDHSLDPDDGEKSIYARWFAADGVPLGAEEFLVSVYTADAQEHPAVGLDAAGNFTMAWQSINQETNQEGTGSSWGVYARQFLVDQAAGTITSPQPQEFRVNEVTDGPQRFPSVGVADAGQFVVSWQSILQDGSSWAVLQRQYLPDGSPAGGESLVNTATTGPQILPVVAQRGSGDFTIVWSGKGPDELEGNWGRRYRWIADDFDRGTAPTLGPDWTNRVGGFALVADRAAVSSTLGVTTLNGVSASDVTVEGFVTLGGGDNAYQGLFARYGGPGDRNMYIGSLVREGAGFSGKIWRNVGGRWTMLASRAAAAGEGLLRFEAFGNSLKLFLDGALVASANDGAITRAGAVGMRGSVGTTVDNFTYAELVPITAQQSPLAFRDFFDARPDGSQLSRFWDNDLGMIVTSAGSAVPTTPGTAVASLNGVSSADVTVLAEVSLGSSTGTAYVGLAARYGGPGDSNMYVGALVREAGVVTAKIWRNLAGAWQLLSQGAAPTATGLLRFDALGSVLALSLDGTTLATASDSAIATGSVGLRIGGAGVSVGRFEAYGDEPPPPPVDVTLPFADEFDQSGVGPLSGAWSEQVGDFIRVEGAAVPVGPAVALATLNGVMVADVRLAADVRLDSPSFSFIGLAARASGPGDTNLYVGSLVRDAAGLSGKIWRNVAGLWTLLAEGPASAASGRLRFDVIGTSLTLSLDGSTIAAANDAAIAGAGKVGMRGLGLGVAVETFEAT